MFEGSPMPSFKCSIEFGLFRDLKAFLYSNAGVTRGETPNEQTRLLKQRTRLLEQARRRIEKQTRRIEKQAQKIEQLRSLRVQDGRLVRMNSRALTNRPFLDSNYEYRPISTHGTSFQALKKEYPYFGYINVEVEGVQPFLMFSSNDDRVAQTYFFYGANAFESLSLRVWRELARQSSYIFDVGAFTGVYSLTAAHANKDAQVHAFEPIKRIYSRLLDNLKVNRQAQKIKASNLAISDADGQTKMNLFQGHLNLSSGSSLLSKDGKEVYLQEHVETMRFDTFVEKNEVDGVDLLKIDVERAENMVVKGMADTLETHKPNLLVEVVSGGNLRSLVDMLSPHGYNFAVINEGRQEAAVNDFEAHTIAQNVLFSPMSPGELKNLFSSLKPLSGQIQKPRTE